MQVTVLALGRLYVKLSADFTLGQLLLPLLADVLSRCSTDCSRRGSHSTSTPGQTISQTVGTADGRAGAVVHVPLATADVAGAVVCALEGMASACVQLGRDTWLYDQALQLLLMMYREPTPVGCLSNVCVCCFLPAVINLFVPCVSWTCWLCGC